MPEKTKIIEVNQLDIGYNGNPVLTALDFEVFQGEILFILGNS